MNGKENAKNSPNRKSFVAVARRQSLAQSKEQHSEVFTSMSSIKFHQVSLAGNIWFLLLGISAFVDFISFVLPSFFPDEEPEEDKAPNPLERLLRIFQRNKEMPVEEDVDIFMQVVQFLDKNCIAFSMLFSFLWFVDAFVRANRVRQKAIRKRDKDRLLKNSEESEGTAEEGSYVSLPETPAKAQPSSEEARTQNKSIESLGDMAKEAVHDVSVVVKDVEKWVGGAWGMYFGTILLQMLLLPVGFYFFAWHSMRKVTTLEDIGDDEEMEIKYDHTEGVADAHTTFTTNTQYSVLVAFVHHISLVLSHSFLNALQRKIRKTVKKVARKIAVRAIRNPRKFRRQLRKVLRVLRWAKYLAPLIGTFNKLLGNTIDLLKKYKQQREAEKAARVKKSLLKEMTEEERRAYAATVIQSNFRSRKARKTLAALSLLRGETESLMAIRIQNKLRERASRARMRVIRKKKELKELQERERLRMKEDNEHMSAEDRKRMYELQDEMNAEAREYLGRKMLLRPNTRFAVTWKILFVACIIVEISQVAMAPILEKYKEEGTKVRMDLGDILEYHLIPTPVSEWDQCAYVKEAEEAMQDSKKRHAKKGPKEVVEKHWYCEQPYASIHSSFVVSSKFLLRNTLLFMGIVCFLDVFVTFFTGELEPDTGVLIPKPFFTRWILPGLVLQMLVNPMMESVSKMLQITIDGIADVGVVRVWRWSYALFLPFFVILAKTIEKRVWRPLVKRENVATLK